MDTAEETMMREKFIGVYDNEREQRILQNTYYDDGIEEGFDKGHAIGHAKGLEEGRKEGRIEGFVERQNSMVSKMLENNFSIKDICTISDLSEEEVEKIKTNL